MLKTTIVGSLPKPTWLAEPHVLFAPWRVPDDRLAEAQDVESAGLGDLERFGQGTQSLRHLDHPTSAANGRLRA